MGRLSLIVALLVTSLLSSGQKGGNSFIDQWKQIDTLVLSQDLSRSALAMVNSIYDEAKTKGLQVQMIKAVLYRFALEQRFTETDINQQVQALKKEIATTGDPSAKAVLSSLLAGMYHNYFQQNRWRFYDRSTTVDYTKADINTWNSNDLHTTIRYWYQQSLMNDTPLKQTAIGTYAAILTPYNTKTERPTLYDLLAHRALNYFKSEDGSINKPLQSFELNNRAALGNIDTFIRYSIITLDSTSNKWKALELFQQLTCFHLAQHDTAALIDVNLERIAFARNNGNIPNKDSLYYVAVKATAERFSASRYAAQAWYLLAAWHAQKAGQYQPLTDTANQWQYIAALQICNQFLPLTDSTEGHVNLYNLYHSINARQLAVTMERVNVPNLPFRTLVQYKNVSTIYYRIISLTPALEDSIEKVMERERGYRSLVLLSTTLSYGSQQQQALPQLSDYQQHAAEIKINPLPAGKYYLLASSSADFSDTARLSLTTFHVSNISFINNGPDYFVLHRTTGKPLVNAMVQVYERGYDNRTRMYGQQPKEKYTTDARGYFNLATKKDDSRNVTLQIKYAGETLMLAYDQYVRPLTYTDYNNDDADDYEKDEADDYEEDHSKAYFFKDRSIYRPGQVVYFKLLALTKDLTTQKTKLFTKLNSSDSEYVYLQDANDQSIDSVLISLNQYGSFAGSFKLPVNTLTGQFSLSADFFDEEINGDFLVEEYKRPTFYIELEKPGGAYRLNDTLTVTGTATAYAGNTVDGANIKYRVTRKGRFMYPWLWYKGTPPSSAETTITFGEATTDAAGKFTIKFAALPDETIDKAALPVFDFEVHADITDRSGETRSETITVAAGYHSLNVLLTIAATAEADSLKTFTVVTQNIAGDKQSALVKVDFYRLLAPAGLVRKRFWPQPDQYIYTALEYKQFFPIDEYASESDKATWPRGAAVYSTTLNTAVTTKGTIPPNLLTPGWYLIEATATDKDGNEIKSLKYTQLYSKTNGRFSGNNYLFTSIINNATEPGRPAAFLLGSNASDVHVIQQTLHQPKAKSTTIQSDFTFYTINKNVKEISVLPRVTDIGGMAVNIAFVKDNHMYTFTQQIMVDDKQQQIDIAVKTYRNKIEPGSKETWTVQLFGKNKEAAAAEVLTSMYDASLDQFAPHAWQAPNQPTRTFYGDEWDYNTGFGSEAGSQNQPNIPAKSYYKQYADIANQIRFPQFSRQLERQLQGSAAGIQLSDNLSEVVVTGYGMKKKDLTGAAITIRGAASSNGANAPLYVVDGVIVSSIEGLNPDDFASVEVLKSAAATALYGVKAANGAVIISTKNGEGKKKEPPVKIRTNFNETAFFYPQLLTDKQGNLSFSFTLPDALTQWKWQVFAHNKAAVFGLTQKTIVSQKTLMIQANAPRFMRQGDTMQFSAKISNLSDKPLNGKATLELIDAITLEPVNKLFLNSGTGISFNVPANQGTSVAFSIRVPATFTNPLTWRVVARAGTYSDGEENTLPVLSNRMLVTESLPLFVKGDTTQPFTFTKLLQQKSITLQHQSVTVEFTTNPVWNAVQSLPYLAKYPYECAEQTFNRFFANALGAYIVGSNPAIKNVLDVWKKDFTAQKSNLAKNEALKNILLQETPWVLEAQSEEQQKKNIALLFDNAALEEAYGTAIEKLQQMQLANGAFSWFKGGYEDRYITQYIIAGIGRLQMLKAVPEKQLEALGSIAQKALQYLDETIAKDYAELLKYKGDLTKNNLGNVQLQYLYTRSYFGNSLPPASKGAYDYYYQEAKKYWVESNYYFRAMTGTILLRHNEGDFVLKNIVPALLENAVTGYETGMYWKQNERGYYWYQAPIEQQALMIEFFNDMRALSPTLLQQVDEMKTWLLRQKQTNHWATTKATADACYALLLGGSDWLGTTKKVTIDIGSTTINSSSQQQQAGSGYFKTTIPASQVTPAMGNIQVTTSSAGNSSNKMPAWGAVYWQYFEDIDKITTAATPLAITKKLFVEGNTDRGVVLTPVNNGDRLKVGDKVINQVILKVDRDMEYVHLKDMRAAAMEPVNVLSGYKYQDGLGYYESTRDAATNFFISNLPKGTYVFEYPVTITHTGNYSVGLATAQCMYAPEFNSHSEGIRVRVGIKK